MSEDVTTVFVTCPVLELQQINSDDGINGSSIHSEKGSNTFH